MTSLYLYLILKML